MRGSWVWVWVWAWIVLGWTQPVLAQPITYPEDDADVCARRAEAEVGPADATLPEGRSDREHADRLALARRDCIQERRRERKRRVVAQREEARSQPRMTFGFGYDTLLARRPAHVADHVADHPNESLLLPGLSIGVGFRRHYRRHLGLHVATHALVGRATVGVDRFAIASESGPEEPIERDVGRVGTGFAQLVEIGVIGGPFGPFYIHTGLQTGLVAVGHAERVVHDGQRRVSYPKVSVPMGARLGPGFMFGEGQGVFVELGVTFGRTLGANANLFEVGLRMGTAFGLRR